MSHEIRTPMNGILGMTSLLLDTALTEEQQQYAEAARSSASALLGIINDILDFSKIEAGRLELAPAPFNLEVLLSEVVRLLSPQAREKGLTLTLRYVPGTPRRFVADALRLRQIVMNLAANAVKFTEKGHVFIDVNSTRQAEARAAIRIAVKDTGIGIAADKLPMLFQRFVQVDSSTTRKFGGTGLGLAISKQLVELMGGELEVTSQPGAGSTFSLRLSLEIDRSAPAGPGAALAPAGLQFALMRGRQMRSDSAALVRVLVAEDNKVNQKVATRLLEKIGCRVDLAENGRLAVEMARDLCYDLIFMDCQMPVMDGFQATELIRSEEGASRRTPIVAMTAFVQEEDRRRCLGSGMDGYIAKPVQPEILAEAVAHWCRPAGVPETAR